MNITIKHKYCIVIGLDYINDKEKKLKGCVNDTILIIKLLIENFNYEPENITLFTDYSKNKATKQNIFKKFKEYIDNRNNIETILIYFSGHGNNNCICIDKNERLFDYDIKTNLINYLLPTTKIICILDCCKSGNFFRIDNWFTNFRIYENSIKLLLISACNNNEIATEFYDKKNSVNFGLFTFYFFEILSKFKNYSWIDLLDLLKNLIIKKNNQNPQIKTINYDLDENVSL
jgi:hypothetical protein